MQPPTYSGRFYKKWLLLFAELVFVLRETVTIEEKLVNLGHANVSPEYLNGNLHAVTAKKNTRLSLTVTILSLKMPYNLAQKNAIYFPPFNSSFKQIQRLILSQNLI